MCACLSIISNSRSSKTFKPKKNIPEGTHQYDLMKHAAATLGSGNLRNAVALPDGEDLNEWVAVNSKCLSIQKKKQKTKTIRPHSKRLAKSNCMCFCFCFGVRASSRRLLQPDQHAVRHHHRVLYGGKLQYNVGWTEVRIPLGRRTDGEEADQMQRAQVHRLSDDLGAGSVGRRDAVPVQDRRAIPEEFPIVRQDHSEAAVPRVRAHLSPALRGGGAAGRRGPSEHIVQAFHILCARVYTDRPTRAGTITRTHRQAHGQGRPTNVRARRTDRPTPTTTMNNRIFTKYVVFNFRMAHQSTMNCFSFMSCKEMEYH